MEGEAAARGPLQRSADADRLCRRLTANALPLRVVPGGRAGVATWFRRGTRRLVVAQDHPRRAAAAVLAADGGAVRHSHTLPAHGAILASAVRGAGREIVRRTALAGLVAGLGSGILALGLGGRLAMRVLALVADRPTHFGLGASLGIVLIGGILGVLASLGYLLVGRRAPGAPALKGALYGTLLFAVLIP